MRRAGTRGGLTSGCGPRTSSRGSAAGLAGHNSDGVARFVALISPSETLIPCRWQRPNKMNCRTDFLDLPRPRNAVWSAKMSLVGVNVNLWKTEEVS